eukprot:snap_masked-scaffold_10-processed-gene-8.18-mRNA-1 protein AED:1.00 eAED:1.00 QI:0/0/0/0/1/1/2/0/213
MKNIKLGEQFPGEIGFEAGSVCILICAIVNLSLYFVHLKSITKIVKIEEYLKQVDLQNRTEISYNFFIKNPLDKIQLFFQEIVQSIRGENELVSTKNLREQKTIQERQKLLKLKTLSELYNKSIRGAMCSIPFVTFGIAISFYLNPPSQFIDFVRVIYVSLVLTQVNRLNRSSLFQELFLNEGNIEQEVILLRRVSISLIVLAFVFQVIFLFT